MIDKMPAQTTVEDILNLFREHERLMKAEFAETERLRKEAERLREQERAEAERLRKEAEQLRKEAERRREQERAEAERLREQERAEAERLRKEERAEAELRMKALERQSEKTERELEKTERFLRELGKQFGDLGNRLGQFVEEMVAPALVQLLQERGIAVTQVSRRTSSKRKGAAMEVDLLAVNDTDVVAVEVKSRLSDDDVRRQLERLGKFKMAFPQYRGYRVLGAVAAMVVPDEIGRQAQDAGLFVLAPSGEAMRILNDEAFEPKAW
jgi:hypothetical protein